MNDRRGSGLPLALLSILVMALLGATVYSLTRALAKESVYLKRTAQAQLIAEAGMEDALLQLRLKPTWRTGFANKKFADGSYTVTLSTSIEDNPWVYSTGYSPNVAALKGPAARTVTAQAAMRVGLPTFAESGFTVTALNGIDSYDSLIDPSPAAFTSEARVWSNEKVITSPGAVRIKGEVTYFLEPAPGAETVTGSITQTASTMTVLDVDGSPYDCYCDPGPGNCFPCNDDEHIDNSGGNAIFDRPTRRLYVSTGSTTAANLTDGNKAAGRIYYINNMDIWGQLEIENDRGPITVYLSGYLNVSLQGSIVPDRDQDKYKIPKKLIIYGQGPGSIDLNAAASKPMYAYIYAPQKNIRVNQVIYGKVVGKTVEVTANGKIHFDSSLYSDEETAKAGWIEGSWSLGY